ncbi:MAG: NAD(P)/FAD-dependent oxidoreductase [Phycisphaerales bacterium]|nr:NAD(P)/FAD-dependent oxidoreductase [Phycisphaerales bacterium]
MMPGAIEGSITAEDAARSTWDAIIIGAGPAGCVTATLLARGGFDVLLVDRAAFPRDKTCGCCVAASAIAALSRLDLEQVLDRCHAAPMDRFDLRSADQALEAPLPPGRVLSRRQFDAALVDESLSAGAAFLPHCLASTADSEESYRHVRLTADGNNVDAKARLVIAAGGLGFSFDVDPRHARARSRPWRRSRLGAATLVSAHGIDLPHGTVRMLVGSRGYVGMARIEDGRIAIAGALDPTRVRTCGGLAAAALEVFEQCAHAPPDDLAAAHWMGAPELTRRPRRIAGQRVLAVGDAAGFVEPFTGEGIAWAIESASAAAGLAAEFLARSQAPWSQTLESRWSRAHAALLAARQVRCRVIAEALRHRLVQSGCMRLGRALPALSRFIVNRLHAPMPAMGNSNRLARGGT